VVTRSTLPSTISCNGNVTPLGRQVGQELGGPTGEVDQSRQTIRPSRGLLFAVLRPH
jgi:hypothetical protein